MRRKIKFLLLVFFLTSQLFALGSTQIWIEPVSGAVQDKYYVGQKIKLQVRINTYGEKITGASFYLTLNTDYVNIIAQEDGKPFRRGNFFTRNPSANSYHDDTPENPDANGITGLQLDYFQQTDVAVDGVRPYKSGQGILAYFDVIVMGIPDNEDNEYAITYDRDFFNVRETGYFLHDNPGDRQNYNYAVPFVFNIFGTSIEPPLPDTVVTPGTDFSYYLGDHFFAQEFDKSDAIWSYEIVENIDHAAVSLDTTDNRDMLTVTSQDNAKGILKLLVTLGIEGSNFTTSQYWNIILDQAPEFVEPFPEVTFLEDVPTPRSITSFVTDNDDPADRLFFRFEGDSLVHIEKVDDLLQFTSRENWYGNTTVTMFVTDSLAPEISKELNITVVPVNDAPVIDFSDYPLLAGDTLVLHHAETQSIDLNRIVSDVDDSLFTWTNSGDSRLDIEQSGDKLNISVSEDHPDFYGTIPLELTVYDDEVSSDTKILYVQVKSYEPEISKINPIVMHADSTKEIDMNDYVYDNDTPIEDLSFEFSAVDSTTRQVDENITLDFNANTKLLTITSVSGHSASDYIIITVTDDDNNQTSKKVILLVVSSYAPKFVNIPPVVVYQDSTKALELDEIVFDVRDQFEDLIINISGNDIFEEVNIDDETQSLIFKSYPTVFGADTLVLSAENTYGLKDSTEIIAYCIPDDNKPVIFDISDLDLYWNMKYEWVDLDDYVFDAFTPDDELKWNIEYSDDLFDLNVDEENIAEIETRNSTGIGKINLEVTNNLGLTSEKEIKVNITKDQKPVWDSFVDIFLVKTQPEKTMEWNIFDKCTDAETASEDLMYSADYESGVIDVDINSNTGAVVLTVIDTTKSETWLKFSAQDENGNVSESQLIDVFIGDGLPPVWRNIPTIYMKNTEIFTDLRLLDYCQDTDDLESDLIFTAVPSNSNIDVELDADTRVTVTPENGIFGENFYIIFKAEDTQGNVVSTSVKLIITNALPPSGFVNYIVNPVLSKRVDFVVSTDSRVEEVSANFKKLPATNISLNFSQLTNNDDGIVWTDDHKFQDEGTYRLIVGMKDVSNFVTSDTLMMTVDFPDNNGAQVAMGSDTETLRLEYPEHVYNNKMFFITESKLSLEDNSLSKSIGNRDIYRKKYKIRSGIASEEILMTLRYKPEQSMSKYHSFYKVIDDDLIPVETFINDEGEFIGYVSEDCEVCLRPSSMAAEEEILPENHFLTYPNPFNPTVNLKFILKARKHVEMIVYNLRGQKVYSEQHYFSPGINEMAWHGINKKGEMMPSGVYFVLLQKNHKPMKIKKVTLFK